ncbi:hypothetical protein BDZ91DRAFT_748566, partial [Kalaharituber pfeilii]
MQPSKGKRNCRQRYDFDLITSGRGLRWVCIVMGVPIWLHTSAQRVKVLLPHLTRQRPHFIPQIDIARGAAKKKRRCRVWKQKWPEGQAEAKAPEQKEGEGGDPLVDML